jgi:hypothetical protein
LISSRGERGECFVQQVDEAELTVGCRPVVEGDSWRIEPNTPVYVGPYVPEFPQGLGKQELAQWYFQAPGVPVLASRVKELVEAAVPGTVGGVVPAFMLP